MPSQPREPRIALYRRGWHVYYYDDAGVPRRVSLGTRDREVAVAAFDLWLRTKAVAVRGLERPKTARHWLTRRYHAARSRARRRGIDITLTREDMDALYDQCGGRCTLTGIEFDLSKPTKGERSPFRMSLDRIDATRGYHADNCRLVCSAVNFAMGHWGEAALFEMARGLIATSDAQAVTRIARLARNAQRAA